MKKLLVVLMCMCIITSVCLAQGGNKIKQPLAGGYTKVSVSDSEVTGALSYLKSNFPVIQIGTVTEAYKQVVSGLNIKMICKVTQVGKTETWEMVVYKDLNNHYYFTGAKYVKQ